MTTSELAKELNNKFGLNFWPKTYQVDHETYANVFQSVVNHLVDDIKLFFIWDNLDKRVSISIGPNNGILFKNVELILINQEENKL